jgi:hypothetical protein
MSQTGTSPIIQYRIISCFPLSSDPDSQRPPPSWRERITDRKGTHWDTSELETLPRCASDAPDSTFFLRSMRSLSGYTLRLEGIMLNRMAEGMNVSRGMERRLGRVGTR